MPDARIEATPMNGMVLLTGTVGAPTDVEEAQRIVQAFVGEGTQVISRLKTATPLQVMLQVKIAEVSRSLMKDVGFNLLARESGGLGSGILFGIGRGNPGTITDVPIGNLKNPVTGGADHADLVQVPQQGRCNVDRRGRLAVRVGHTFGARSGGE
jgi:pilus assembly protein CpaC